MSLLAVSVAGFVRADSGPAGVALALVLGGLLTARLFARELAAPLPPVIARSLDGTIAVLFVLFVALVGERFHVLG